MHLLVFARTSFMLAPHNRSQQPDKMKPTLYLIPGTQCNARLWSELTPCLSDYELVHLPIPFAKHQEQLIEQLAAALPGRPIALLGFSAGAYLAALFTLRYPDKVARLMLVSNSPCPLSADELATRQQNLQLIERFGYKGISQKKAQAMIDTSRHDAAKIQHLVQIIRQMDNELGEQALKAQLCSTSERKDLKDGLLEMTQPLSVVYSDQDVLINHSWMHDFARQSQAVIHQVAGAGHMLPLEHPLLLSQHIRQWLSQHE